MKTWYDDFGRTDVASLKTETLVEQTQACLSFYGTLIKQMLSRKHSLTWNNIYHPLEVALSGVENFSVCMDFAGQIGYIDLKSPEFKEAESKITSFFNQTYFNRKISLQLHQLRKSCTLSKKKSVILDTMLSYFSESFYPKKQQKNNQKINLEVAKYEDKFLENMRLAKKSFYLVLPDLDSLKELPQYMKEKSIQNAKSLDLEGKFAFDLQTSTFNLLMQFCSSRPIRQYIYKTYVNLKSKENDEETLKKLIHWRNKQARIYGHNNYTDYAVQSAGLDCSSTISGFLDNIKEHFQPAFLNYNDMMKKFAKEQFGISRIFPWDKSFLRTQMNKKFNTFYNLEGININYDLAVQNMFELAHEIFGLRFVKEEKQLWHDDVVSYQVFDKEDKLLGNMVFDSFSREQKKNKMVCQYVLNALQKFKNKWQPAHAVLLMHLEKDSSNNVVFSLEDMIGMYHEFGHALHTMLTQADYHYQHPLTIEYDAIEFPSQWFERFAKKPEVLGKIAFQNSKPIGLKKAKNLVMMNDIHDAPWYWTHILHSKVDIHLNSKFRPNGQQSFHQALSPIFSKYAVSLPKYNNFQTNQFEHFYMGSTYYGYLWSEHMIQVWEQTHGQKSLQEQGVLMSKLLNNAAKNGFTEEFSTLVKPAHDEELNFVGSDKDFKKFTQCLFEEKTKNPTMK